MRKFALITVVALTGVFAASTLLAQDKPRPRKEGQDRPAKQTPAEVAIERINKAVGGTLTDDQKTKITDLANERAKAMKEIEEKFQTDVKGVLTAEQQTKMKEAPKEGPRREGPRDGAKKDGPRDGAKKDGPRDGGAPKAGPREGGADKPADTNG